MAKCSNCSKTMSCGCQRRTASDGRTVCSSCSNAYEKSINSPKSVIQTDLQNNVGRYKNLHKFIKT